MNAKGQTKISQFQFFVEALSGPGAHRCSLRALLHCWKDQGAVPLSMSPGEFDKYLRGDIVKWAGVVKTFADNP
ncbi:hypothetical protein [Bradyrhizobium sp.]|jgi:hypothetical protein|uniref:hypothetical protein n=1 Tax=Bradyrhizobium sp. TaxID=376 RepID=UPI003C215E32